MASKQMAKDTSMRVSRIIERSTWEEMRRNIYSYTRASNKSGDPGYGKKFRRVTFAPGTKEMTTPEQQRLLRQKSLTTKLHAKVSVGKLRHVRLLVEQGADKNNGDSDGNTPLRIASFFGHLDVVQYLVEQGSSLEKANNYGFTPLSATAYCGHLDIARFLLEQGADRDKANDNGWTPLHYAASKGRLEFVMLLMSYGADLNARTNDGQLPIDTTDDEEIKQAIRNEPKRRMDHGHKRAQQEKEKDEKQSQAVRLYHKINNIAERSFPHLIIFFLSAVWVILRTEP